MKKATGALTSLDGHDVKVELMATAVMPVAALGSTMSRREPRRKKAQEASITHVH